MPPVFGSSAPKCVTCQKSVYAAEQVLGPGGKAYHKPCLKCLGCGKTLDARALVDHDGDPYCKACHAKHFGPKGYGVGGALTGEYVDRFSPSPAPSPPNMTPSHSKQQNPPASPLGAGSMMTDEDLMEGGDSERAESPTPSNTTTTSGSASVGGMERARSPLGQSQRTVASTAARFAPTQAGRDLCRRCGTVVYFAESVLAVGHKWHKRCLRCAECGTALSSHLTERDGLPFCKKCYNEQAGLKAQGIMSRPGLF